MKVHEIAEFISGTLDGNKEVEISSVADIAVARAGQIAFFDKLDELPPSEASCIIVGQNSNFQAASNSLIKVKNPKFEFAKLAARLNPRKNQTGISSNAAIAKTAQVAAEFIGPFVMVGEKSSLGSGCVIHDGSKIGAEVKIGENTTIFANCVIYAGVTIGDNCVIHAGTVIGADGFGYVRGDDGQYIPFPQIGSVVIENNVEIGANSCIDRGALGETRIGEGTKIDNLVQIGHNVNVGKHCVIAAQTGISGSVVIEDNCVIGGQVGFGDHVRVQSGAIIGSQAGILPGKIVRPGIWWGTPIQPLEDYKRQNAHLKGLGKLKEDIKAIKRLLTNQEKD